MAILSRATSITGPAGPVGAVLIWRPLVALPWGILEGYVAAGPPRAGDADTSRRTCSDGTM